MVITAVPGKRLFPVGLGVVAARCVGLEQVPLGPKASWSSNYDKEKLIFQTPHRNRVSKVYDFRAASSNQYMIDLVPFCQPQTCCFK